MGQAAGTAAGYAIKHGVDPMKLKDNPGAVWSIQQQLIRDDAFVIGLYNEVSKSDEFCIKNEELCIKNEGFWIKMMNFAGPERPCEECHCDGHL